MESYDVGGGRAEGQCAKLAVTLVNAVILGFPSLSRNDPAVAPRKRRVASRHALLSLSRERERDVGF